jgi:hypothetical protein
MVGLYQNLFLDQPKTSTIVLPVKQAQRTILILLVPLLCPRAKVSVWRSRLLATASDQETT